MSDSSDGPDDEGIVRDDDGNPRFRTVAVEKSDRSGEE